MRMTKKEFLAFSGIQGGTLDFWLEQEWLIPERTRSGPRFNDIDIARAHFIQELKTDFGANDEGIDVILHLVDQLHGLRRVLERLRGNMPRSE